MAQANAADAPKTVPKRTDVRPEGLFRNTRSNVIDGQDPDFQYQSFSEDPDSPAFIGKRLHPHRHGPQNGWQQWIGAWEQVHSQTDRNAHAAAPRTDQGAKVDTLERYGRQIVCRIPKSEFAKYAETDRKNQDEREKQLHQPDRLNNGQASMTALVMEGDQSEEARMQGLANAGHNFPGMPRAST